MEEKLTGQTALVTGGARGIGRAYALRLARLGADVAILDLDLESFRHFELEQEAMTADAAVAAAVDGLAADWGHIDIVICNAGSGAGKPRDTRASEVAPNLFDEVLQRNLYGTYNTCRAVVPYMKQRQYGRIVTISSQAGRRANRGGTYAHYGAAKAGIEMYTRYLAQELGPFGITANCIAPGPIGTGRLLGLYEDDQEGLNVFLRDIPLGRLGTPEDCARVIEFLVTDLADYINGAVIPVDGGAVP
jgi:3-oxoacyl-[acyl-carrier protein] reductase